METPNNKMVSLNLETRLKVIEDAANGLSQRKLADKYKCGKTQIQKILKQKDTIKERWLKNPCSYQKRDTYQRYKEVNELTLEWFENARARKIPITGTILQEKAKNFARELNCDKFSASSGWLGKFCRGNNIALKTLSNESECDNEQDVANWLEQLPSLIEEYNSKDIYNVVETALYYRTLPTGSLHFKDYNTCESVKVKHRITIMFCVNSVGEKEPPLLINDVLRPKCFKNVDISRMKVGWYANETAWMTEEIFTEWLEHFNDKMKKQKREVLLLLDNAPCHPKNMKLSNVKLLFLPANISSASQPLHRGVIQLFKLHYWRRILITLLARAETSENVIKLIKDISVADVVEYVKDAWNSVSEKTTRKCFKKCGMNREGTDDEDAVDDFLVESDVTELGKQINLDIDVEFSEDNERRNGKDSVDEILKYQSNVKEEIPCDDDEEATRISLKQSLRAVQELKQISRTVGNYRMVELITEFQNILEEEIVREKSESGSQLSFHEYFLNVIFTS